VWEETEWRDNDESWRAREEQSIKERANGSTAVSSEKQMQEMQETQYKTVRQKGKRNQEIKRCAPVSSSPEVWERTERSDMSNAPGELERPNPRTKNRAVTAVPQYRSTAVSSKGSKGITT